MTENREKKMLRQKRHRKHSALSSCIWMNMHVHFYYNVNGFSHLMRKPFPMLIWDLQVPLLLLLLLLSLSPSPIWPNSICLICRCVSVVLFLTIARHYFIARTILLIWIDHFYGIRHEMCHFTLSEFSWENNWNIFKPTSIKISQDFEHFVAFIFKWYFVSPREWIKASVVNLFIRLHLFFSVSLVFFIKLFAVSVALNALTPAFFVLTISDGLDRYIVRESQLVTFTFFFVSFIQCGKSNILWQNIVFFFIVCYSSSNPQRNTKWEFNLIKIIDLYAVRFLFDVCHSVATDLSCVGLISHQVDNVDGGWPMLDQ